jgi:hypothetical protein
MSFMLEGRKGCLYLGHVGDTLPSRRWRFRSTTEGADRNRTGVNGFAGSAYERLSAC